MSEYISVSEFAKRAGVSRQTIYNRLDKDLSNYTKLDNNRKLIDTKSLSLFRNQKSAKDNVKDTVKDDALLTMVEMLKHELEVRDKELEIKNQQIEALNRRLEESYKLQAGHLINEQEHIKLEQKQPQKPQKPSHPRTNTPRRRKGFFKRK